MRYRAFASAAAIICCIASLVIVRGAECRVVRDETEMIPLRFAVVSLGKAYECYFTIEECWVNEEAANAIEGCLTRRPDGVSGLDREMNGLVRDIPQLSYAFDEDNPKVIHLIDNRLNNQEGYALSAIVQKVDFSGYIGDFVSSLAAEGVLLARSPLTSNEPADVGTTVHASGRNLVVRRALTKFIPLEGRGPILWIARTKLGVGQSSHIQFYGAPRKE